MIRVQDWLSTVSMVSQLPVVSTGVCVGNPLATEFCHDFLDTCGVDSAWPDVTTCASSIDFMVTGTPTTSMEDTYGCRLAFLRAAKGESSKFVDFCLVQPDCIEDSSRADTEQHRRTSAIILQFVPGTTNTAYFSHRHILLFSV